MRPWYSDSKIVCSSVTLLLLLEKQGLEVGDILLVHVTKLARSN